MILFLLLPPHVFPELLYIKDENLASILNEISCPIIGATATIMIEYWRRSMQINKDESKSMSNSQYSILRLLHKDLLFLPEKWKWRDKPWLESSLHHYAYVPATLEFLHGWIQLLGFAYSYLLFLSWYNFVI